MPRSLRRHACGSRSSPTRQRTRTSGEVRRQRPLASVGGRYASSPARFCPWFLRRIGWMVSPEGE
jgi:hypothetical protein